MNSLLQTFSKPILFIFLVCFSLVYLRAWARNMGLQIPHSKTPSLLQLTIGFVTNFFDSLGIGSFAPTTSWFKLQNLVPDEHIPGTMHVGHSFPVIVQAFVFMTIIQVDMPTLIALIVMSVAGAWLGARSITKWPRNYIQIGLGLALGVAAVTFVMQLLGVDFVANLTGDSLKLTGSKLWIGMAGTFVMGALMTLGVGMYAPTMIMVSMLGMNPIVSFPIMMGSCAFLMPTASIRFMQSNAYSLRPALGLALGGVPGVLLGAFVVKEMPLDLMRWLVVAVVTYTSFAMLRSAYIQKSRVAEEV
ncbi:MAG TPA: sulfite exporter TauE/SafE family protein [Gemmatimonadetes bacterium]|nr:sulfite exporter TauE/SafE family protein [Gemmatimonadota bacterium]